MRGNVVKRAHEAGEQSRHIGDVVRYYRDKTGLSARALSLACGLSESYVGKMESNSIEPSLRAFALVAEQLDLNATEVGILVLAEARRAAEVSHPLRRVN